MKGIILAGGYGTRLSPLTLVTSKQLLPIYDKPMIYYSLSTLMLSKVQNILIISTKEDIVKYRQLLGDGHQFGIHLSYCIQERPGGIAQAFTIGMNYVGNDSSVLILGDNIFYGRGFSKLLQKAVAKCQEGIATVFGYFVPNPEQFGVVEFDDFGNVISIEEKPKTPKSNYAITGLYYYPSGATIKAKDIKPSFRDELEITTLNNMYLLENKLKIELLGRDFVWFDTGTFDSLADAAEFVRSYEKHYGIKISVPEEIAFRYGWISKDTLITLSEKYKNSKYGLYLRNVAEGQVLSWFGEI